MSKNLVIVFTRNPELGKVKTRLSKTIGNQAALKIYKILLNHTEETIRNIESDKAVYYSVKKKENDIWSPSIYLKYQQQGIDLGIRMLNAFKNAFESKYEKVLIIGSDLYDLKPEHIEDAFTKLDKHELVIGPALDGGYYLLGMKTLHTNIFKNKTWGTSTVFQDTMKDLQNVDVHLLQELNDIDVFDDLKKYPNLIELITNND